jgi:hypothetical protein
LQSQIDDLKKEVEEVKKRQSQTHT